MYLRYLDLTKTEQETAWDYADMMRLESWEVEYGQFERQPEGISLIEVTDFTITP